MIIKTWRDPYDSGFSPTKPKEIELKTGLTVLVGCNGAGKSTLLKNIKEHCTDNKIPTIFYNNLHDGGSNSISELIAFGQYDLAGGLWNASEGEAIKQNISGLSSHFKFFFENGYIEDRKTKLHRAFTDEDILEKEDEIRYNIKERVLLFDAVDSGLSVDSVIEIKMMFDKMIEDIKDFDKDIYIIIAANEYELARNVDCFDVNDGVYLTFNDYEDYRKFIIKSRQKKEKRIDKQIAWTKKQHDKELKKYIDLKTKVDEKIKKITDKYNGNRPTWKDSYNDCREIEKAENMLKDFVRHETRFLTKEETGGIY